MSPLIATHGALALLCALLAWKATDSHYRAELGALRAEQATDQARAAADAQQAQIAFQTQLQEARDAAIKREAALRRDVAGARAAVYGLRGTVDGARAALPGLAQPAAAGVAAAAAELLGECADRYAAVAESADRHAADALMLRQAWPVAPGAEVAP